MGVGLFPVELETVEVVEECHERSPFAGVAVPLPGFELPFVGGQQLSVWHELSGPQAIKQAVSTFCTSFSTNLPSAVLSLPFSSLSATCTPLSTAASLNPPGTNSGWIVEE